MKLILSNAFLARLRYEVHILGIGVFGLPLLTIALFVAFAALAAFETSRQGGSAAVAHHEAAVGLLFLLEAGIPLVAGLAAAFLIANNPAKELHFTLLKPYRVTMAQRLAIFTLWAFLVNVGAWVAIALTGYWVAPHDAPHNLLIFTAPLLWFIATGALLSLLIGSWVASSTILGLLWIGELLLRPWILQQTLWQKTYLFLTVFAPDASYWQANRLTLLALALLLFIASVLLLRRNEAILGHEV